MKSASILLHNEGGLEEAGCLDIISSLGTIGKIESKVAIFGCKIYI